MQSNDSQIQIFDPLNIQITLEDVTKSIQSGASTRKILRLAENALAKVQGCWRPRAIVRRLDIQRVTDDQVILEPPEKTKPVYLNLGYSSNFMLPARQGFIGVYTAGDELEQHAAKASLEKRIMDAYLYDHIGLAVLEKTRLQINRIVEEEARVLNWGVGPFLSPGSVHGWELSDQENLCALVPIERIDVVKGESGILKPFKTISCLIGIGPDYEAKSVGSTCQVCARNSQCEMRTTEKL